MDDTKELMGDTTAAGASRVVRWFTTNDKEWSKRLAGRVEKVFYLHTLLTLIVETILALSGMVTGQATSILLACIPVYSAVLLGMLAKSGVENVYKGKTEMATIEVGKAAVKQAAPAKPADGPSNG